MKKQLISLFILSTLISSTAWAAGPVANIKLSGEIKPPTCAVNGIEQNDVVFDYGAISPSMVPQSSTYMYPTNYVTQQVTVTCDVETYLTFKSTDTYQNANTSELIYPFVSEAGGQYTYFNLVPVSNADTAIGGAMFRAQKASVDGKTTLISRANDGVYTGPNGGLTQVLVKQATTTWTTNNEDNRDPEDLTLMPGKVFSLTLVNTFNNNYRSFITSKDALTASDIDISNGLDFMGEAVLTFSFGV